MSFIYSPTFKDYWALNVYAEVRTRRFLIVLATVVLALIVVEPWLLHEFKDGDPVADYYKRSLPLLILPGGILFLILLMYLSARIQWAARRELRQPREYEIDDSGLRVKAAGSEGFLQWRGVTNASVTSRFVYLVTAQQQYYSTSFTIRYLFFTAQRHYYYFPVSIVPDMQRLRELIKACVKSTRDEKTA